MSAYMRGFLTLMHVTKESVHFDNTRGEHCGFNARVRVCRRAETFKVCV